MDDGGGIERFNDRLRFNAVLKSIEWENTITHEMFLPCGAPRTNKRWTQCRWDQNGNYIHESQTICRKCIGVYLIHDPVKGHHCPACYAPPKPVDIEWNNGELRLFD